MMWEVREDGVYVEGVRQYVAIRGGRLAAMVRAQDKDTFDAMALQVGLKVYTNPGAPEQTDPETGDIIAEAIPPSGPLIPAPGVDIEELGAIAISPDVTDTRHHVNFWLDPEITARGIWVGWATAWTTNGQPEAPNKDEAAVAMQGIALIDPATVHSPSNRMLA